MIVADRAGRRFAALALPVLALFVLLASCATHALPPGFSPPQDSASIAGVAPHEQRFQQCGPAALASVLNYYGDPATPDEIGAAIYRPGNLGTLNLDLALYPRTLGFATEWYEGSLDGLLESVRRECPVIVMVDRGFGPVQANHFMVVVGYAPQGLTVLAGGDQAETVGWARFDAQWAKTNRWTLEVAPEAE